MKTFLKNIGLFLLSLGLILPFWDYIIRHSKWDNIGILNFQVEKIKAHKGRHFSIIYIGDSSGGYALSSSEDSSEINLCLTGSPHARMTPIAEEHSDPKAYPPSTTTARN
jgi:hypothetical protein